MKDQNDVIQEFNEIVNMTASELEKWLKSNDSNSAGWSKDDGSGESVGHDSGRKIVEILKSNPNKKEDKYTEDQIQHMRKVVSYCKRHLAQEEKSNNEKPVEEVKQTKSYASLKNWGHDPIKKRAGGSAEEDDTREDDDAEEDENEDKENVGDKRKKSSADQSSSNKKRETRQGKGTKSSKKDDDGDDAEEQEEEDDDDDAEVDEDTDEADADDNDEAEETNGNAKSKSKKDGGAEKSNGKAKKGPKPGDTVSWNWGNGQPEGKVLDVKPEKTSVTTKRGNEVSRDGDEEDPAVVLDTGKSKAIKSNHELN